MTTGSLFSSADDLAILEIAHDLDSRARELMRETLRPLQEDGPTSSKSFPQKTFDDLQWSQLMALVTRQAQTPEGYHILENLRPPKSREAVEYRLREVAEVMELLDTEAAPPLGGLRDIRRALQHVIMEGTLVAEDLEGISRNCDVAARVHRYFQNRSRELPLLSQVGRLIDPCENLRSALSHAIEPGGRLADTASPDLGRLRRAVQNQHDRISTRVDQLLGSQQFENALRDDYFTVREDRYVLPIRVGAKTQVPGIVHAYSSSGQTAFIEPQELVDLNNQLRWAQIELQEEIDRILKRLSRLIARDAITLLRNVELLAYLDVILAVARFGQTIDATVPTITDDKLDLRRARHPLLDLKIKAETRKKSKGQQIDGAVPNDVAIDRPRHVLIISGPNTGGKTITLKTTGLCALMARFGLPLPVDDGSSIPIFKSIFTDVGDEQSIERDLSTFSGHVVNINGFLDQCGPQSLVLLDELFVGTDPMQGAALAVALLENLAHRGTTTVVTTHLEGLKTLAYQSDSFANASMGFDLEELSPTYQMTMGIPGSSFAVRIAARLGLKSSIVDRSQKILEGQEHHSVEEVLEGLEEQVRELQREKSRLHDTRKQAEKQEKKYREKHRTLLKKERGSIFDETKKLREELREARDLIRQQLKKLQREKTAEAGDLSHRDLHGLQEDLKDAESKLEETRDKTRPPKAGPAGLVPIEESDLEEGMLVFCRPFKRQGELITLDRDGGARVQIGDLKVNVSLEDLFYPTEAKRRAHARGNSGKSRGASREQGHSSGAQNAPRIPTEDGVLLPQTSDNSVDLRGLRTDEATERVDLFLDHAYLNNIQAVYIIHGHGTGALKRAVRGHLPQSRYIKKFRRGERGEGGDGVTIAYLKREA